MRSLACLAWVVALSGPAAAADLHLAAHPLVGTIVRTEDGAVLDRDDLEAEIAAADFVVIGEKHDNPRHHAIQAELVDHLGATGRLEAVALEMLDRELQRDVVTHFQGGGNAAALAERIGWDELGWGPWTWYGPIVHAGHRHGATIVAANLGRSEARTVYDQGFAGFDSGFVARTGLDVDLDAAERSAREAAMVAAHCGHPLGDAAAAMVDVQRARDAMMADRLARLANDGIGALITGNGHADKRQGVPPVLERLRPDARVLSLGLVEVEEEWASPADAGPLPYDLAWFTPRAEAEDFDYCARFSADRG